MAGPTTAQRGKAQQEDSPARPPRPRPEERRLPSRRALIVTGVLALLLVSGAVWALYGSSWLRAEQVRITGVDVLTPAEVEAAAAVPIGAPLISVDTDAIAARLRQKLPRIDSVDVVRSWPHGIGLKVTERQPVLLIEKGAKFIEVDAKGVRFATVDKSPGRVPLLELKPDQSASLRRFGSARLVREAVRVAGELPGGVAKDTEVVRVTSYDSISLQLTRGRTVIWGSGEGGPVKARVLTALMKAAPKAGHFDVSAPTAPSVSGS
ncbi:FtsQ-type POTRA domain-containing protein [Streptomyces sp. NBC_00053]|uniref:cell division protein FtsQ/DivIB n=1 Tax=unclassified Streptomyces TaxID=2593676 RepID=UPI000F5BE06E|nr:MULTISPECIES: FtsQ-type POTRA domain-containing protein [unclassified Streptomyces]WSG50286.1 FtsQ-type POTRA domain-containing protein [Streptomyces sp. NBC_01732]WSX00939.1 FtsQ-type POTRA domain-containing protein [Streptomyces sp. NBC_00987]MCX4397224.1 FtsQ-type POTRA domain-containing protein [Streptomyces sp. NBC_01767]MCX5100073.1 FtsQ-type POTRA domain-containing protein [Streptomyces sp. NBC_00439]MCX5159619.1 FtsQ-type POTRA domain-containing protein [Streptomyces sp. NBC_00305]